MTTAGIAGALGALAWTAAAFGQTTAPATPPPPPAAAPAAKAAPAAPAATPAPPKPAAKAPASPSAAAPAPPAAAKSAPAAAAPATPEARFIAALDAAIAPARATAISAEDATRLRDAMAAAQRKDVATARALREQIADPLARKVVDWARLRLGVGEAAEYRAFIEQNPAWGDQTTLAQRYEEALFTQGGSARAIKEAFGGREPRTGVGLAALASAHLADGDTSAAATLARTAWTAHDIPATLETGFMERFGALLTPADHRLRLDRLLLDESRWASERGERAATARRMLALLAGEEKAKAEARLAVYDRAANAEQLLAAQAAHTGDWGLAFQRIQHLRRAGRKEEAWRLLLSAPLDPKVIVSPDDWWDERRANAYAALAAGNARVAYDLVKAAGPLTVNPKKDQAFMAGWLAFRHLKDLKAAEAHFQELAKAADGPLSKSRADYWLGRLAEAKSDAAAAEAAYRSAARYIDTFHGQLARLKLGQGARLEIALPQAPSEEEVRRFNQSDAVRAAVMLRKSGAEYLVVRTFLARLQQVARSEGEVALVAHLAEALGDTQMSVRIGKAGIARGMNLVTFAYPFHTFPSYQPLRPPPETAFLLGVARQESEFNPLTVSGAGARGILQVMPVTARHVCRDYKIKCELDRLLTDPAYNATVASAYIGDRMGEFAGSYVLSLAGFNAGPGRARQWIREFGDPRDPAVDAIDWIHRIPFEETREYVQKVLANVQVYRARLAGGAAPLKLAEDLARARGTVSGSLTPGGAGRGAAPAEGAPGAAGEPAARPARGTDEPRDPFSSVLGGGNG